MKKVYNIQVELKSPLYINPGNEEGSVNVTAKKEIAAGEVPFIPASTVKGKLRDGFRKIINEAASGNMIKKGACGALPQGQDYCDCPVCQIFGKSGFQPSRIYIEDLVPVRSDIDAIEYTTRPTVAIDRYRRVVKKGALTQTIAVEKGCFTGKMIVFFSKDTIMYESALMEAVKGIVSIGGMKSRGFGFVEISIEEAGGDKHE